MSGGAKSFKTFNPFNGNKKMGNWMALKTSKSYKSAHTNKHYKWFVFRVP